MEKVIEIPAYKYSNLERLEDGLSSLYELKKTCIDPNNHVGELINEYEANIQKIENDLREKVDIWKTTLLKYWKMTVSTIVNDREYTQIKYIFPYRLVDANNTLFTLTATDDDMYNGGVYTKTYSIDDLSKSDIKLEEISKYEFERIVHKSCDNTISSRINKILSHGLVKKNIIIQELGKPKPAVNDKGFVDLGLPSRTLWAKCNLGAEMETDFGKFFQWGDTQGYSGVDEHQFQWSDYKWGTSWDNIAKYNVDNCKKVLDNEDDPVFVATNGKFKLPTKEQLQELIDCTNHEWTSVDGVNGMKFVSKSDDTKYIFIPVAGYCLNGNHNGLGSWGSVWSASSDESSDYGAWEMSFYEDNVLMYYSSRCSGYSVRGVVVPDEIDDTDDGKPVDLGLPSGTKWMKSNIGATKPSDFGKFYQWGDIQGYEDASEHQFDWSDYKWGTSWDKMTKYNNTDHLTLLEAIDDSAVAATGGQASMPTKEQLQELIDNTEHRWLSLANGFNGIKFWKKGTEEPTDGNSYIFIPAAGCCGDGGHYDVGSWGRVWSASRDESSASSAWYLYFDAGYVDMLNYIRCDGYSVRAVVNK